MLEAIKKEWNDKLVIKLISYSVQVKGSKQCKGAQSREVNKWLRWKVIR